jgi:hypothetical protein
MVLMDKQSSFKWNLVNVYGASNSKDKSAFLVELVEVLNINAFPFLIGGDFNLV